MIYIHSTVEIDIDIELTKAKIKLIKDKMAERIMFRSRVKWVAPKISFFLNCYALVNFSIYASP